MRALGTVPPRRPGYHVRPRDDFRATLNYLAHLYLAADDDALIGNLLGDFAKGRIEQMPYPPAVLRGVLQHRLVDSYTDRHPCVLRSKRRISPYRRRFAGIIVDMCYDHFLARQWSELASRDLRSFCRHSYDVLRDARGWLPHPMPGIIDRMAADDWLGSYAQLQSIDRALEGISRRFRRPTTLPGAVQEIHAQYCGLEADFKEFFPQLRRYAADIDL